jgi:hypothetical protein
MNHALDRPVRTGQNKGNRPGRGREARRPPGLLAVTLRSGRHGAAGSRRLPAAPEARARDRDRTGRPARGTAPTAARCAAGPPPTKTACHRPHHGGQRQRPAPKHQPRPSTRAGDHRYRPSGFPPGHGRQGGGLRPFRAHLKGRPARRSQGEPGHRTADSPPGRGLTKPGPPEGEPAPPPSRRVRGCPFRPSCPSATVSRTMIMEIPQPIACFISTKTKS